MGGGYLESRHTYFSERKEKHCMVKLTSCFSFAAGMRGTIVFAGGMLPVCPC